MKLLCKTRLKSASRAMLVGGWLWVLYAPPASMAAPQADRALRTRAVLEVGKNPHQIAFSADGTTAFVAASGSDWVARVDVESLNVVDYHPVADAPIGVQPLGGNRIAVSRFGSDRVSRFLFGSHTADGHLRVGGAPSLLVSSPAGGFLVSSERTDRLWLLDLDRLEPLQSRETGARPFPPAPTPDGRLVFVPNYNDGSVSVIDLKLRRTVKTIPVGANPSGGVVLPGKHVYAVAVRGENRVALIDTRTLEVTGGWSEGIGRSPFSVVTHPGGRLAFVNNTADHDISVVAIAEARVVARIPVGEIPIVMALHPSGDTLWVSSEGSHTLSIIDIPPLPEGELDSIMVDVDSYRPPAESRQSERKMYQLCSREVTDLHQFFQEWFTGDLPPGEEAFHRLEAALADDFEIISPGGTRSRRAEMLQTLRSAYGEFRQPPLRIWIENFQGRSLADGIFLATYEEWQQHGSQPKRGRLSTVLFRRVPEAPGGVRWVHVHEVWMPRSGPARH